jgi:hypothetical protein
MKTEKRHPFEHFGKARPLPIFSSRNEQSLIFL